MKQLVSSAAVLVHSALALGGLTLLAACAPANFSGSVGSHELGAMPSAYYSAYEDNSGISMIYFSTESWTCEELQAAASSGEEPQAEDPEKVVGAMSVFPYIKSGDLITAAEGEYAVVDDLLSAYDLNDDALFALIYVGFSNESGTVSEDATGEVGKFTLSSVDIAKQISGTVNFTLSNGELVEGSFKATRCDL